MGLIPGKCPSCGANLKIGETAKGELTCPFCGETYLVENAINIIRNETINNNNFSGANVVINQNSKDAYIKQYLENARRALKNEDWEEVNKYYDMVEQYEPRNIEAIFYSSYAKARLSMLENDFYKREQICDVFCKNISVIDDYYDVSKSEVNRNVIAKMCKDLLAMYEGNFLYKVTTNEYGIELDDSKKTYFLFAKMAQSFIESIYNIIKIDDQTVYWKLIYSQQKYLVGNKGINRELRQKFRYDAINTGKEIHDRDPKFVVENIPGPGACYIATCVYGSYDCPEVWTLRRFRDEKLSSTWYGRCFIKVYYTLSPTLIKIFGNTKWFKRVWHKFLDKKVKKLQEKGVESTPYQDKEW